VGEHIAADAMAWAERMQSEQGWSPTPGDLLTFVRNWPESVRATTAAETPEANPETRNLVELAAARMVCKRCQKPIRSGQSYAQVRLPDGSEVPVHGGCMEGDAS
jgi:hypothetical protein